MSDKTKKFLFKPKKPGIYEIVDEFSILGRGKGITNYYVQILKERMTKFNSASVEMIISKNFDSFLICTIKDKSDEAAFLLEYVDGICVEEEDWEAKKEASLIETLEDLYKDGLT
jgi:disulfide oxidoreductase YuzD